MQTTPHDENPLWSMVRPEPPQSAATAPGQAVVLRLGPAHDAALAILGLLLSETDDKPYQELQAALLNARRRLRLAQ
jgi:hypothetical protein